MATFNDFWTELQSEIAAFAEKSWSDFRNAAVADANTFANDAKADLQRWTNMLAQEQLTRDEFEWLLQSEKDIAELTALKQAGQAQVALDRFVNGLLNVVITSAFKVFT